MSHTKGKWSFGHNVGVYSGNTHIADIAPVENGFEETLANAKLIAAAPDLLEALHELIQVKEYRDKHGKDEHYLAAKEVAWKNAREARYKAVSSH